MSDVQALLDAEYSFGARPHPIPAELRTERKVALLLLLVSRCHGAGASWKSLHVLNWAVRSSGNFHALERVRDGELLPDIPIVRIEPALDRAIDLSAGLGYLERKRSGTFRLLPAGTAVVVAVEAAGALATERALLDRMKNKVTQTMVESLLGGRA
ncbi:MAG: hypothetical protein F2681_15000 [Actinobacteria bacterium]|uniref:Unannotated protein n=1 Tax=freshwater metagenome TaxID=449393 RepID=A0A6J7KBL4_9ZZZZ|nr:hypothetical protein [Actinomycetota bacterium]MSW78873.1 hypothetical protein [Actinomycetota bacterium]MSX93945.1 hypothetical protein [Actinomycetota bacterium]MSZ84441.1 hypothetical protein [Actinomycetota bacterium]MTB19445.1 hypothetical protein [Actinomycetota bacterium]